MKIIFAICIVAFLVIGMNTQVEKQLVLTRTNYISQDIYPDVPNNYTKIIVDFTFSTIPASVSILNIVAKFVVGDIYSEQVQNLPTIRGLEEVTRDSRVFSPVGLGQYLFEDNFLFT